VNVKSASIIDEHGSQWMGDLHKVTALFSIFSLFMWCPGADLNHRHEDFQ
jgi:hypothetical protein